MKDVTVKQSTIQTQTNENRMDGFKTIPIVRIPDRYVPYNYTVCSSTGSRTSIADFSARLRVINRSQQFAGCGTIDATVAADQKESASII